MQKSVRLDTREQRKRLPPRHEPYYVDVAKGVAIGYRRGVTAASWYLRRFNGHKYHKRELGQADDEVPADGVRVLAWPDVVKLAIVEPARANAYSARYAVHQCIADYFDHRRARGRSGESIKIDEGKVGAFLEKFADTKYPRSRLVTFSLGGTDWLANRLLMPTSRRRSVGRCREPPRRPRTAFGPFAARPSTTPFEAVVWIRTSPGAEFSRFRTLMRRANASCPSSKRTSCLARAKDRSEAWCRQRSSRAFDPANSWPHRRSIPRDPPRGLRWEERQEPLCTLDDSGSRTIQKICEGSAAGRADASERRNEILVTDADRTRHARRGDRSATRGAGPVL